MLLILFVSVAGLAITTVSAATKTTGKIYFKDGKNVQKSLGKDEYVSVYYSKKPAGQQSGNFMCMGISKKNGDYSKYYKMVNATVKFSKKVNGKNYYSTKTFKAINGQLWGDIIYYPKNGYKPYYAMVTYKNK